MCASRHSVDNCEVGMTQEITRNTFTLHFVECKF